MIIAIVFNAIGALIGYLIADYIVKKNTKVLYEEEVKYLIDNVSHDLEESIAKLEEKVGTEEKKENMTPMEYFWSSYSFTRPASLSKRVSDLENKIDLVVNKLGYTFATKQSEPEKVVLKAQDKLKRKIKSKKRK